MDAEQQRMFRTMSYEELEAENEELRQENIYVWRCIKAQQSSHHDVIERYEKVSGIPLKDIELHNSAARAVIRFTAIPIEHDV